MNNNSQKILSLVLFIFSFLACYSELFAQQDSIIIEHLSTKDGLSHRHIHCVMEDSYGFLWIGTNDGLNRYDGYEFIVYSSDPGDTTSLSSPTITLLTEDGEGNIWVGTPNGLNYYQRESDSFKRYIHDPQNKFSISDNNNIESLLIDKTNLNYLWVGTDGSGLNLLDIELQRFYNIKHDSGNYNSLSEDKVVSLFQDSIGELWIGTSDAGLNRVNLNSIAVTSDGKYDATKFNSTIFEHYLNDGKERDGSNSASVYNIYEDKTGTLWVLLKDSHVLIFNRETNKLIPSPYFNSFFTEHEDIHFHEMVEDHNGILWFGAHNKIFQLNRNINRIKEYTLSKENTRSSSNQGLCEDNVGNIWSATWDGLVRIHGGTPLFEHHYHKGGNSNSLNSNKVYSILADHSGKVWIGTDLGLSVMIKEKNGSVSFLNYSETHQINEGVVLSLIEDYKGSIWAVIGYTLVRIDPRTNSIVQYKNSPENTNAVSFQKKQNYWGAVNLFMDDANNLWISAHSGGFSKASLEELYSKNNLQDIEFINYFSDPKDPFSLINHIILDRLGFFWISTETEGIIMFDPETEIIKNYKQELNNPKSLSINNVNTIYEDKKGIIWIGTEGGGLNEFDRDTESFTHFGINDGLPSNIIQGILEDDNGNLWISTNRGITKFNSENKKFRNYDVQENEYYSPSFLDTLTGKMYIGGRVGFNVFHPDSIKENNFVPPVILTKFVRFSDESEGEQIIDRTISAKNKIELSYSDNLLSFEFAALGFNSNNKYYYAYQLEGLNKEWINIENKREITFTNLSPGDYTLKVKACNEDGVWCENYASVGIYISPPWWLTIWAYSLYGVLFIGSLYGIRRFEINRRNEREEKRILGIENKRKTEELERARALQLSMLPKEIPYIPNLDIAVHLKTATEVGGDYYDFHFSENKSLTVVLGDATGHGLDAGMLVSVSKGLFQNLANQPDLKNIVLQFNNSLISMKLQPMYMSACFLRIQNGQLQIVGAGMPPPLYYNSKKNIVEEIEAGGPPLGGFQNFNYEFSEHSLSAGDIIVLMSDGFAERMNENKEIIGWDKGKELLARMTGNSSNEIIHECVKFSDEWGEGRDQNDDITIVVLKVK